jgi:transposase
LEFILAGPARRYGDFEDIPGAFHRSTFSRATEEMSGEFRWQDYRLIVAHRPDMAQEQSRRRDEQIAALNTDAARWTDKLDARDDGERYRGRKLSDAGGTARFYKAVSDARLAHIIKFDLSSDVFYYDVDERALNRARMLDGKLLLVTNVTDHTPEKIVARYKALADIERGFWVLKSEVEIAPVFNRGADRIRAHALICFLALVLYRVLRMRLKDRHSPYSPEWVLEIMRRIQFHQVTLHQNQTASGLSTLTPEQRDLFDTIDLAKPTANHL